MKLTSLSKGSGCGCKISPAVLEEMLHGIRTSTNVPHLLVGNGLNDDCSVMQLDNGQLLLQTVDFFTPIVNDAYVFGAAAAANSLSDIWAMGGKVLMANAVFSWPLDKLSVEMGRQVLKGAADICHKFHIPLAGGHSIDGGEPLFGLSVTGTCSAAELKTNAGAKAGDYIYLTKSLGVGMLAAAHKRDISTKEQDHALFDALQQTNDIGEKLGHLPGITAMTDVTGFGLAGHLLEMCKAANLGATIEAISLPMIAEAKNLADSFILPDNAMRNWNAYESDIELKPQWAFPWLVDPQTNGGLLISVDPKAAVQLESLFLKEKCQVVRLGTFHLKGDKILVIEA